MRTIAVINYQSYWRILTSYSQAGQCPLAWGIWRSKPTRVKPPGEMTKIPRAGKAFPCTPLSAYINIISLPLGLKTALCKLCISTAWPFPAPPRRHFLGSSEHDRSIESVPSVSFLLQGTLVVQPECTGSYWQPTVTFGSLEFVAGCPEMWVAPHLKLMCYLRRLPALRDSCSLYFFWLSLGVTLYHGCSFFNLFSDTFLSIVKL